MRAHERTTAPRAVVGADRKLRRRSHRGLPRPAPPDSPRTPQHNNTERIAKVATPRTLAGARTEAESVNMLAILNR